MTSRRSREFDIGRPAVLNALYQGPPGWDAVIMIERPEGTGWVNAGVGDDPPELNSILLRPGHYRLCVRKFGGNITCAAGEPASDGSVLYSVIPMIRGTTLGSELMRPAAVEAQGP